MQMAQMSRSASSMKNEEKEDDEDDDDVAVLPRRVQRNNTTDSVDMMQMAQMAQGARAAPKAGGASRRGGRRGETSETPAEASPSVGKRAPVGRCNTADSMQMAQMGRSAACKKIDEEVEEETRPSSPRSLAPLSVGIELNIAELPPCPTTIGSIDFDSSHPLQMSTVSLGDFDPSDSEDYSADSGEEFSDDDEAWPADDAVADSIEVGQDTESRGLFPAC
jgi:hypothetical protein